MKLEEKKYEKSNGTGGRNQPKKTKVIWTEVSRTKVAPGSSAAKKGLKWQIVYTSQTGGSKTVYK